MKPSNAKTNKASSNLSAQAKEQNVTNDMLSSNVKNASTSNDARLGDFASSATLNTKTAHEASPSSVPIDAMESTVTNDSTTSTDLLEIDDMGVEFSSINETSVDLLSTNATEQNITNDMLPPNDINSSTSG